MPLSFFHSLLLFYVFQRRGTRGSGIYGFGGMQLKIQTNLKESCPNGLSLQLPSKLRITSILDSESPCGMFRMVPLRRQLFPLSFYIEREPDEEVVVVLVLAVLVLSLAAKGNSASLSPFFSFIC